MISIVIPSKNERFLRNTILDVLAKSETEIEVFPVLDGYSVPKEEMVDDPRVRYIQLEQTGHSKKRQGINKVVNEFAKGEYVCWMDAHVMVDQGWDRKLLAVHQPNWVQVPRRKRLDAEKWSVEEGKLDIDYEYFLSGKLFDEHTLFGHHWDALAEVRRDILIDDILTCQGSFFFMEKDWFKRCGFMDTKYQGWGQEAEEVVFQTVKMGGRAVVNKTTWYAHLRKGKKYGRMYHLSKEENRKSYDYSFNHWVIEEREFFKAHINRFPKQPKWPENWEELLYI